MIAIDSSEQFERLLDALAADVVYANIHWQHAEDLHKAFAEYPDVWAQSQTFWHLTLTANRYSSLQALCRVYDQNDKSLHLLSWLTTIRDNLHLFEQSEFKKRLQGNPFVESLAEVSRAPNVGVLDEDISLCSIKDPDVLLLTSYRGGALAHRNAKATKSGKDRNGLYALPGARIEVLLSRAVEILNRYSYLFKASVHSTKMLGHDDYAYVFKTIQADVDRLRARHCDGPA